MFCPCGAARGTRPVRHRVSGGTIRASQMDELHGVYGEAFSLRNSSMNPTGLHRSRSMLTHRLWPALTSSHTLLRPFKDIV